MRPLTLLLLLTLTVAPLTPSFASEQETQGQPMDITVPDGSAFTVVTADQLSSKTALEGDPVNMRVADDVLINGHVAFAKGTLVRGTITKVGQRGHLGKGGKLALTVDYTTAVDGQKVKLRASKSKADGSTVGSTVALSVLVSPMFLFRRGNNAVIQAGTKIQVYTDEEFKVKAN